MKKLTKEQVRSMTADAGFYIILLICLTVICISGYVLFFTGTGEDDGAATLVTPRTGETVFTVPGGTDLVTDDPVVPAVGDDSVDVPAETAGETEEYAVEAAAGQPAPIWVRPVAGEILRPFTVDSLIYDETMGDWRTHAGVDYAAENGTRVYAISDGTVAAVTQDELYGTQLTLTLADGRTAVYRGLAEKVKVRQGETVRAGDVIGTVGTDADPSERALGSHLHLEVLDGETPVDPELVISGEAKISSAENSADAGQQVLGMDDSIPQDGIYVEE